MAVRRRPLILHQIADQVLDQAKASDLAAARKVIDRLDGKAVQGIDCGDVQVELTDSQLYAIAASAFPDNDMIPKALPPPREYSQG